MINKIIIENFRSIEHLELDDVAKLSGLVGPNSSGKTNILKALDIVLGETYPTERAFTKDDFYQRDPNKTISVQIWFDQPLGSCRLTSCDSRLKEAVQPISLQLTHTRNPEVNFGAHSFFAYTNDGRKFWASSEARDQINFIYLPSERSLDKQLSVSNWTLLGKILKKIDENFRRASDDNGQPLEMVFKEAMRQPRAILESEFHDRLDYAKFKNLFTAICKQYSKGLAEHFELDLEVYDPLFYYKTIQIIGSETLGNFNVEELGSGVQNLVLLSLFLTYGKLMKSSAIMAIEEPEIFLYPQAQRQLFREFREIAYPTDGGVGTQIFYTTHSPNFVDSSSAEDIRIIRKSPSTDEKKKNGSLTSDEKDEIKLLTEFNQERNEIFFADYVVLVEGDTEKHSIPTMLERLGFKPEELNIVVISAEGKTKLNFLIRVCEVCQIKWVALYDTDEDVKERVAIEESKTPPNTLKLAALKQQDSQNDVINSSLNTFGENVIALENNFQDACGLQSHKKNKWREIKEARDYAKDIGLSQMPAFISRVIELFGLTSSSSSSEPNLETESEEDDIPF